MASTSHQLIQPFWGGAAVASPSRPSVRTLRSPSFLPPLPRRTTKQCTAFTLRAKGSASQGESPDAGQPVQKVKDVAKEEEEEVEVEEDFPWIQEKALDLVEFTGNVSQAIPGPRVGQSKLPWLLAVALSYVGISFVIAFVKTVKKLTSPRAKKKRLVNKNATLLKSIDDLLLEGRAAMQPSAYKDLMDETGFNAEEVLRKYIRYTLNEKPFNPEVVMDLISLRKASELDDPQVAEVLNEISRRIVKDKGPVVMDMSGFTEKGLKRKIAVQALFGKVLYLSELPEFCAKDSSLVVKEIFGVTDEDAEKIRISTLSNSGDLDSLEKMVGGSDSEESGDAQSKVA